MNKILKSIVMAALIGALVGVGVSILAPAIAGAAGFATAGNMASPVFMALFAGSWGALGAAVTPAISFVADKIFNRRPTEVHDVNASSPVQTVTQHSVQEEQNMLENCKFTKMIEAEKARAVELGR